MNSKKPTNFPVKIFRFSLAAALPSYIFSMIVLWQFDYSNYAKFLLASLLTLSVFGFSWAIKQQLGFQFQTLSNLVEAIRNGDFTLRGNQRETEGPLADLTQQIFLLSETLSDERITTEEAYRLLNKAIAQIDVAIFAFDAEEKVKLANPAAGRLMGKDYKELVGKTATQMELGDCLALEHPELVERAFPGGKGRWKIRLDNYRDSGMQRKLLFITDLKAVLREEELKAWKNLIRVISHEVNNSLYPISSISQSLRKLVDQNPLSKDWKDDVGEGLTVIGERASNLTDFIKRYTKVAHLPEPNKQLFSIRSFIASIGIMQENPSYIHINPQNEENLELFADKAMFEQLLINLLKNAIEAGPPVTLSWGEKNRSQWFSIIDSGPGISEQANLFVPFYSTKPEGSGIGLVLCQQIIDKHLGSLDISNHPEGGCQVMITLPSV